MKTLTVLLGLLIWFFLLWAWYGLLPTLISFGALVGLAIGAFVYRALTRANRHIDRILAEELGSDATRPDTNGETR